TAGRKSESPRNAAVRLWLPAASDGTVMVTRPFFKVPVATMVELSLRLTVPPATTVFGAVTEAVKVTGPYTGLPINCGVPTCVGDCFTVRPSGVAALLDGRQFASPLNCAVTV